MSSKQQNIVFLFFIEEKVEKRKVFSPYQKMDKSYFGITTYDTDDLKRLRIGQRFNSASNQVVILEETATTISYTFIDELIQQTEASRVQSSSSAGDVVPLIISVWTSVKQIHKMLTLRDYSVIWYSLHVDDNTKASNDHTRNNPIVEQIRSLYTHVDGNVGPFNSLSMLEGQTQSYIDEVETRVGNERRELIAESRIVDTLASLPSVEVSQIEYTRTTTIVDVKTDLDPEDIYNSLVVDSYLPMANYTGEGSVATRKQFYKVYQGSGFDLTPPFKVTWLTDNTSPESINMRVFTGLDPSDATDKDYTSAVYHWGKESGKQVRIKVPFHKGFTQDKGVDLIFEHLKGVEVVKRTDKDIEGSVKIRKFSFRDDILTDMVMNDPIFSQYLHIRETSLIAITNRRPTYHMSLGEASLQFRIENKESRINEPFLSQDGSILLMEEKTPYTTISIDATNDRIISTFLSIIPRLLSRYSERESSVIAEYQRLIPQYGISIFEKPASVAAIETTIKQLENLAPRIFVNNYASYCQEAKRQPIILNPDQVDDWHSKTFIYRNQVTHRQTMPFPLNNENEPTRIYACPGSEHPYPGLVVNQNTNRHEFPYVPCCFGEDQSNTPGNPYGVYYKGDEKRKTVSKTRQMNITDTDKFVDPESAGSLPRNIDFVITKASPGDWYRVGTVISPNSALHCVASVCDAQYPITKSEEEREKYVRDVVRRNIIDQVETTALKQELFKLSQEDIQGYLDQPDSFFDTKYLYRALEIAYDINLVVFTITDEEKFGSIELPEGKGINYRPHLAPSKPTLMLYKHTGGGSSLAEYPQYELIGELIEDVYEFTAEKPLASLLSDMLVSAGQASTWQYAPPPAITLIHDDQANVVLDLEDIFKVEKLEKQYLDGLGKLRIIVYDGLTIVTPLNRPLNLPPMEIADATEVDIILIVRLVNELRADGVDALIYALNSNEAGQVVGVWWYVGEPTPKSLFFTPCIPTKVSKEYTALHLNYLPYPSIFSSGSSSRNRYDYLERVKYLLLEILKYCFNLYLLTAEVPYVDDFLDKYTVIREGHIYQPSNVNRYLPVSQRLDVVLTEIEAPTFVERGKIILSSEAVSQKIVSYLTVYAGKIEGLTDPPTSVMQDFYRTAADFTQRKGEIVFDEYASAFNWVNDLHQGDLVDHIITTITPALVSVADPYVFKADFGYLLIQNVIDGNLERALNVTSAWDETGTNIGYEAEAVGEGAYAVYPVNEDGRLGRPLGTSGANYLLRYGNGQYAAILFLTR